MATLVALGLQWGDEGKGKIIDLITDRADIIVRYQGGHNAGHTVVIGDDKYILHLVPSGIFHKDKTCIIGNGVVIELGALLKEIEFLNEKNIITDGLMISKKAHLIMPYHCLLDNASEARKGSSKIGTTGRGIGPAYTDKAARSGIRVADLLDNELFKQKLSEIVPEKNFLLRELYGVEEQVDETALYEEFMRYREILSEHFANTDRVLRDALKEGKNIICEGAQGAMLDVDHGTYPYVTSSNPTIGGVSTGTGLPGNRIDAVLGVVKAYTTRVGGGPFPTELDDENGQLLRDRGNEYGSTTGRPRRCGWLDGVVLKETVQLNGVTSLALTKLDVLDRCETIRVCTGYEIDGVETDSFPYEFSHLERCVPVYREFDGWMESIEGITEYGKLPARAKIYIDSISEIAGVEFSVISTGPRRDQTVILKDLL